MKVKYKKGQKSRKDSRAKIDIESRLRKVDIGVKDGVFIYTSPLTVEQFSQKTGIHINNIIKYFFSSGINITINSLLSVEQIGELCLENNLDFQVQKEITRGNVLENLEFDELSVDNVPRPPIVTVMGHVDHGKTTLLDTLRKTNVVAGEKGGITQHIGSYQVSYNGNLITFIDTPGHEAFTEMRHRGVNITDVVVLVVAADDGVKPQTEEAIDHARQANVPIIVFVNKMDKPNANPERVLRQLANKNLVAEEWNGDTVVVYGSALKNEGIDKLLEHILAFAELINLRANPRMFPYGVVMDAKISSGLGIQANVIVLQGTLMVGDQILIGSSRGKVRMIIDDNGKFIKSALPSQPVQISGLNALPNVGDKFVGVTDDKIGKRFTNRLPTSITATHSARNRLIEGNGEEFKVVNLILKVDAQGSLVVIENLLEKAKEQFEKIVINTIRIATGGVTENDVRLAQVSGSVIISFNVAVSKAVADLASSLDVIVKKYDVIYKLQEDLVKFLSGFLEPVYDDKVIGEAVVRQLWFYSKIGTIAGCYVTSGKMVRNAQCNILRDNKLIYQSTISSLRQGKENVNEVVNNSECGIVIDKFNDIKVNDIIQTFEKVLLTDNK